MELRQATFEELVSRLCTPEEAELNDTPPDKRVYFDGNPGKMVAYDVGIGFTWIEDHHDAIDGIQHERSVKDFEIASAKIKRTINVWVEGYAATGERAKAHFGGSFVADTFDDAVKQYIDANPSLLTYYNPPERLGGSGLYHSVWGCGLFDNELDARKSFG